MNPLLRDLYYHQAWADATFWNALEAYPAALEDEALLKRQHHIHIVQHGFLWAVQDQGLHFTMTTPEDFPASKKLKNYAMEYHDQIAQVLDAMSDLRLHEMIQIPWFKDPLLSITVEQALTQTVMHSQYHRGQNATRLREVGGVPPLIDFIAWYWKGRAEPQW